MTLKDEIKLLREFAAQDLAERTRFLADNNITMAAWCKGRATGYARVAQWLEDDVMPHYIPIISLKRKVV